MTAALNHTIVYARDRDASAQFIAELLGVAVAEPLGSFRPVPLGNGVTLDYMQRSGEVTAQHYAFVVDDETFDTARADLDRQGITIFADPGHQQPGEINTRWGGRGMYFDDPNGHNMELMTSAP